MSESPHDPPSAPREPDGDRPPAEPRAGDDAAPGAPAPDAPTADTPTTDAPATGADSDTAERTPERPPPYQGVYGAPPGQAPPAPVPPAAPAAGYGQPQHGHPPQGYPQPGYPQPGYPPPGAPHPGAPHPGAPGPQDVLAGRWARLGAGVLDSLILSVVGMPAVLFSIRWDRMQESIETGEPVTDPLDLYNVPRLMVGYAIVFLLGFAYFTVMHAKWGQTIGKKALGIRVVSAADHSAVSWGQAAGRQAIVYAVSVVTLLLNFFVTAGAVIGMLGMLDNAWILWDERRQALHDKAARTLVVKTAPWIPNPYDRSS